MNKVSVYKSFDALPVACEAVFGRTGSGRNVFLSLPWFRHLTSSTLSLRAETHIYVLEGGDGLPVMALPMWHDIATEGVLAPRTLTAAANYYSSLFSALYTTDAGCSRENLILLASAIAADARSWDCIDLHPLDVHSPLYQGLMRALREAGMAVQDYFCFGNWYLDVNGRSYAEYLADLPAKLRNTLKRKSRALESASGFRLEIITAPEDVARGVAAYQRVYGASWKNAEAHPEFIPGLIRLCAEQGWLRLGIAYVDNEPAAAQLWITDNGIASIYKLAYDSRFIKLSIGTVLTAHMMRHAIDVDRVHQVDYLTGDDAYKRDWMSARRERWGIRAFNMRTVKGRVSAVRHLGGRALKNLFTPPGRADVARPMSGNRFSNS